MSGSTRSISPEIGNAFEAAAAGGRALGPFPPREREPALRVDEMALRADEMVLCAMPSLFVCTQTSGISYTAAFKPGQFLNEGVRAEMRERKGAMERSFALIETMMKEVLTDARGDPLIREDEELLTLKIQTMRAIVRGPGGEERTVVLVPYLHPRGSKFNAVLKGHFDTVKAYVCSATGRTYSPPPRLYLEGQRGNSDWRALPLTTTFEDMKLPSTREEALARQLDTIGHEKSIDSAEKKRQKQATLRIMAGSWAFFDTYAKGLELEIDKAVGADKTARESVVRARRQEGSEDLGELITIRKQRATDLARLRAMQAQFNNMSFFSLMSAERARPIEATAAAYKQAAHKARNMTYYQLKSTKSYAEQYAAASAVLVIAQAERAIEHRRAGGAPLPVPEYASVDVYAMCQSLGVEEPNAEGPLLRFYDFYTAAARVEDLDQQLFAPHMYDGLSGPLKDRLAVYQARAVVAMNEASTGYDAKKKKVRKGYRTWWKNSGMGNNLNKQVVKRITAASQAAVFARFNAANEAPSADMPQPQPLRSEDPPMMRAPGDRRRRPVV